VIAIVGKTKNDSFYQQAFKGCLHFSNEHPEIECKYDGPKDFQIFVANLWSLIG